ncbi:Ef-Hand Calcium-Binding Domain-Containing Protein 6 [Manis pentadactyla]|nr:Ef-Hand Calcium-Binding Domain-Containing Protein 6 [Manis pentadactyla]
MDSLSANQEWGCFAGTGSFQNKSACEFPPHEACGGLWSRLHPARQKSALVMPGTGGPGAAVPPPRTSSESQCRIQIIVMNCSALEVERTQLMEEGI